MVPDGWLKIENVLPRVVATDLDNLISAVARNMTVVSGLEEQELIGAFRQATKGEGFSLGSGVAIPHTEHPGLQDTVVCLATTQHPLALSTIDGRPPDIFLFILSKPDPHAHLVLLAHWARLAQSRTFLEGLRRSTSAEEMVALVSAAELRHKTSRKAEPSASHDLILISVSGEKVVDALLIGLMDEGFEDASVVEAQSLHEAATREVPLFAGFRDIFGDPGGRRLLVIDVEADRTEGLLAFVRRVCEEHRAKDARVMTLPVQVRWATSAPSLEETREAHG